MKSSTVLCNFEYKGYGVKSEKLQEVNVVENLVFDRVDSFDLFWKIFNHNQFAIAVSDEQGNLLLNNHLFVRAVIQIPIRVDFLSLIQESERENKVSSEVKVNTGHSVVKLSYFKLAEKGRGVSYLWLATTGVEMELHNKILTLKNLYRSFIDSSFELIFRTSLDGSILFANHLFLTSFGFKNYKEIKGSRIESIFEDPTQYKTLESQLLMNRRVNAEVIFFKKKDGSRLTVLVNCHLHYDELGTSVFNWTGLDVTHQIESENTLRHKNEELAKVNHQMEKFLYSTSHDLRSPITSILGLVNLMRMESKEPTIVDYVSKIESSTFKLDKIIKDIMSFSRTTYQRLASERIDFELMIWKIINLYRMDPVARKINFEVKVQGAYPYFTDPERLDIIMENIIRNCIHFFDGNKSRPFVQVKVTIRNESALIEFIDNGIGIGQQHLDHIFNMFYKASHLSKGAGLGLYIVKETVEKLGGTITVESEIGFGTVVRVSIPNDHKGRLIGRKLQLQNNS